MLILTFCRNAIRDDEVAYNSFLRTNIPERLELLSVNCDGFLKTVDKSVPGYGDFMTIINRRNFALHGNVDPVREPNIWSVRCQPTSLSEDFEFSLIAKLISAILILGSAVSACPFGAPPRTASTDPFDQEIDQPRSFTAANYVRVSCLIRRRSRSVVRMFDFRSAAGWNLRR